jgi:hypothetical protein
MSLSRIPSHRRDIACAVADDLAGDLPSNEVREAEQSFRRPVEVCLDIRYGYTVRNTHGRRVKCPIDAFWRLSRPRDAKFRESVAAHCGIKMAGWLANRDSEPAPFRARF